MKLLLLGISLLVTNMSHAKICPFLSKLHFTVNEKYSPLVGEFDKRGRFFQPTKRILPGIAKCRVSTLNMPATDGNSSAFHSYSCRWEFELGSTLTSEFKSMLQEIKKCKLNKKLPVVLDITNERKPRNSSALKWSNYSKKKIYFEENKVLTVSKQTVTFTKNNKITNILRFKFGAFEKK